MATDEPVKYADKSLKEDRAENSIIKPMNKCYAGYLHLWVEQSPYISIGNPVNFTS
jgi:hypothetical protein